MERHQQTARHVTGTIKPPSAYSENQDNDENNDAIDYTNYNFARQHEIYKDQYGDVQACPYGNITVAPLRQISDDSFP